MDDGTIVRRDPRTKKYMAKETSRKPTPAMPTEKARSIRTIAKPYTNEALQVLLEMMRGSDVADGTRLKAIEMLLAYGWGKPFTQQAVNEEAERNPLKDLPTGQLKKLAMEFASGEEFEAERVEDDQTDRTI